MKKIISFIIVICLVVLMCGCTKRTTMEIDLKGNPTTGYEWTCDVSNKKVVVITKDKYVEDSHKKGMVGVGGTYKFYFEGLKKGRATITFKYARSFDTETRYDALYKVKVDKNKNITITNTSGSYSKIPAPKFTITYK